MEWRFCPNIMSNLEPSQLLISPVSLDIEGPHTHIIHTPLSIKAPIQIYKIYKILALVYGFLLCHILINSIYPVNLWFGNMNPWLLKMHHTGLRQQRHALLSSSSMFRCDVSGQFETPAKELGPIAAKTQDAFLKTEWKKGDLKLIQRMYSKHWLTKKIIILILNQSYRQPKVSHQPTSGVKSTR